MSLIGRHDNGFANLRAGGRGGPQARRAGLSEHRLGRRRPSAAAGGELPAVSAGRRAELVRAVRGREAAGAGAQPRRLPRPDAAHGRSGPRARASRIASSTTTPIIGTPLGTAIAAPVPQTRELMCRDGLKYYARIPEKNIRAAQDEVEAQRAVLRARAPANARREDPRARNWTWRRAWRCSRAGSCCGSRRWSAAEMRRPGDWPRRALRALRELDRDFRRYWPLRNKGTTAKCSTFLRWRMEDYRRGTVYYRAGSGARAGAEQFDDWSLWPSRICEENTT